jgi:hypothetical protein
MNLSIKNIALKYTRLFKSRSKNGKLETLRVLKLDYEKFLENNDVKLTTEEKVNKKRITKDILKNRGKKE